MTVWCHLPTIFNRRYALRLAGLLTLCVALTTTLLFATVSRAVAGINQTLSFQGRLLNSTGGIVADGNYNIQFKIYQDGNQSGTGSTLKWTETYVNNNSANGIEVKNGYFSATLGSVNPFGSQVDWNQDTLWLSMNVAGSANNCTTFNSGSCTADGEMMPMKRITSTPYALNSGMLGGKTADNFIQLAQGVQEDANASDTIASLAINRTGSGLGDILKLQADGYDMMTLDRWGNLLFGGDGYHTIGVAKAPGAAAGKNLTVVAGTGGYSEGWGGDLQLQGGASGGYGNARGGNVEIDAGAAIATGPDGDIKIGTAHAATIQIGRTDLASGTQTINIGNNNTSGGTTNITIGGGSSSTAGTTAIQSKGNTTISTNSTTRATFDNSGNLNLTTNTSIQADSTSAFNITDTDSNSVFNVDTTNKQVTVGTVDPTTLPILTVAQSNASDAALEVKNASNNYYLGVDASDSNRFKLGSSAGTSTSGITTYSGGTDSGNNNIMSATLVQAKTSGAVTKLRMHFGSTVAGHAQMALYSDNGSRTAPSSKLTASASDVTPVANSWVDFTVPSYNVTAGTYYWLVFNLDNATTTFDYSQPVDGGNVRGTVPQSYGTWPSSWSGGSFASGHAWAANMEVVASAVSDQFAMSSFSIGQSGDTLFKNVADSMNAFSVQTSAGMSLFNVDTTNESVRIGDGAASGSPTLFTLDRATAAPTVDSSMLGSMYYDTTLGKVQCYEADGWGACGAAPDTFVTLSPEYANAVMHGSTDGTMTSDLCSYTLNINDGTSSQPTICGSNETYNFYHWTTTNSSTPQTKSIFVTYQLPSNFKAFVNDSVSLMGRTDDNNATVTYQPYRNNGSSGLISCGSEISVSTGSQSSWQKASAGNSAISNCDFEPGDSIVIRINLTAKSNFNAYVSNLNFAFSNQ